MDTTMSLTIGMKGQLKLNAQAVPLQEGYLKIGGLVDVDASAGLKFGTVCSANPDTPDQFEPGVASGNVIRGIAVFDDAIAQNAPAHADRYLAGFPCAAINHGFLWIENWGKTATGAADPVIGSKVIYNTTSGEIEFIAANGSAPADWAELGNAQVRAVETNHGALIYID